jgi:hypothetical protein
MTETGASATQTRLRLLQRRNEMADVIDCVAEIIKRYVPNIQLIFASCVESSRERALDLVWEKEDALRKVRGQRFPPVVFFQKTVFPIQQIRIGC